MTNDRRKRETVIDRRFGFDVMLVDVPLKEVRGEEVPDVNANDLRTAVLAGLTTKPGLLSGAEVRFVRLWMEKTTTDFGEDLGVTHGAVLKWEKKGQEATGMNRATEYRLRLLLLTSLPEEVQERVLFAGRQEGPPQHPGRMHLLSLIEDLWREMSTERREAPLRIPPELVAQQSLQKLRM